MKVIQVSSYYPPRLGGMQNVMREVSERLAARGHDVEVFASKIGIDGSPVPARRKLRTKYLWGVEVAHTAIIPTLIFELFKPSKGSIIHLHAPRPYVAEIAALVAKIRRVPYVVHVHSDIQPLGFFKFLIDPYKKYPWMWVVRGADTVIFLSRAQESEMRGRYGLARTTVIPNGVDEKYFVTHQSHELDTLNLLFVGRLNNQKDVPFLIEVARLLPVYVTFTVVGEGEMRVDLEKQIRAAGLERKVFLVGQKTGQELIDFYRRADIYVMASHFEGLSLSMLEAMATGLPVVALDAPGVTEHLERGGVIVRDRNIRDFVAAIDNLRSNPERLRALGTEAQGYARELSWDKVITRLESVYTDALRQRQ